MVQRILIFLLFCAISNAWSQGYYSEKHTGGNPISALTGKPVNAENDVLDDLSDGWQLVMAHEKGAAWSKTQMMPINFQFAGSSVVAFKASNSGIITFDTTTTGIAFSGYNLLPYIGIPKKSITFLGLQSGAENDRVVCKVFGTAPYRQLCIKYNSYTPYNDTLASVNATVAAVFEETTNKISLVFMNENALQSNAIIPKFNPGIQTDFSNATPLNNNGNVQFPLPLSSKSNDNYYYEFDYGTQIARDLELTIDKCPLNVKAGSNATIEFSLVNNGSAQADSTIIYYQTDGGAVQNQKLNFSLKNGRETSYSGSISGVNIAGPAGTLHKLKIWVEKANNTAETITNNDSASLNILAVNGTQSKGQILLESVTAAWCGICPGNNLKLDKWKEIYGDTIILVQHHQLDEMQGNSDAFFDAYFENTPAVMVNRNNMPNLDSAGKNIDKAIHESRIAPAVVQVENMSLNDNTGEVKYSVLVKFEDYFQGEMNIGGIVLEDNVRGSGSGFNQTINDTLTNDTKDWFYNFKNPITGYYHQHVAWHLDGGAQGLQQAYKSYIPGDTVRLDFSYTIPQLFKPAVILASPYLPVGDIISSGKPADIQAVGFASYTENGKENFINAGLTPLWNTNLSAENLKITNWNVYPNPASDRILVQPVNQIRTLEIVDLAGNKLFSADAKNQPIPDIISLANYLKTGGIYFIRISDKYGNISGKKLIYIP